MTTIAIITSLFCLIFLVAALVLILADKLREVVKRSALDYVEVWSKYHEERIKLEQDERQ